MINVMCKLNTYIIKYTNIAKVSTFATTLWILSPTPMILCTRDLLQLTNTESLRLFLRD